MKANGAEQAYREAVDYLRPYITRETGKKISILDKSMDPDRPYDFIEYLNRSYLRYRKILEASLIPNSPWLEVGALYPAFPITLAILGHKVWVAEDFSFYPKEISRMYQGISKRYGIKFVKKNLASKHKVSFPVDFQYASLMGVIEHLPHTPRILLENIYSNLSSGATFFLDVPNLFYSANIAKFFRGIHIQQPIQTVYESGIPFVGHHREYNVSDLRFVLERSGFEIHKIDQFNYSTNDYFRFLLGLGGPVLFLAQFKPFKEVIFVESRKP